MHVIAYCLGSPKPRRIATKFVLGAVLAAGCLMPAPARLHAQPPLDDIPDAAEPFTDEAAPSPFEPFDPLAEPRPGVVIPPGRSPSDAAQPSETESPQPTAPAAETTRQRTPPRRGLLERSADEEEWIDEPLVEPREAYQDVFEDALTLPPNSCSQCTIGPCRDGNRGYAHVDFLMYQRARSARVNFTYDIDPRVTPDLGQTLGLFPIFSTEQMPFDFEPGARVTFGACLGEDPKGRDHSLEITFLGVNEWQESRVVDRGGAGTLISGFFLNQFNTVFDSAHQHLIDYASDLNSVELNYRMQRPLGKDRMVFRPSGTWSREAWPGWTPAGVFGLRFINLDEQLKFHSNTGPIGGPSTASGNYQVETRNRLFGMQGGGEFMYHTWKTSWGVRGKAGVFINWSELAGSVKTFSMTPANVLNVEESDSDQDLSFVGELSLVGNYRVSDNFTLRASYDFLWTQGLALAPEQMTFNVNQPTEMFTNGFALFQGISLGGEFTW